MAYHSFLLEPISCHAWNKDRTREYAWGTPEFPGTSPGTIPIPEAGDAPGRGRAALGLHLGKQIWQIWGLGQHIPLCPRCQSLAQRPAPRHRQGREGAGDAGAMAFPERGPGDAENKKGFFSAGPERRAGGAGWGWIWELCTPSRPVPSHPVLSHPTSPMGPHHREGMTLGCGVLPSPRDNLLH